MRPKTPTRFFRFKPEFGWAESFSAAALVVALWALYQSSASSRPDVFVEEITPRVLVMTFPDADTAIAAMTSLLLTNRGGRDVSLTGIRRDQHIPIIVFAQGNRVDTIVSMDHHVFLAEQTYFDLDVSPKAMRETRLRDAALELLAIPIPAGGSKVITLGVYFEPLSEVRLRAEVILFLAKLRFSNGFVYEYRHAYPTAVADSI